MGKSVVLETPAKSSQALTGSASLYYASILHFHGLALLSMLPTVHPSQATTFPIMTRVGTIRSTSYCACGKWVMTSRMETLEEIQGRVQPPPVRCMEHPDA